VFKRDCTVTLGTSRLAWYVWAGVYVLVELAGYLWYYSRRTLSLTTGLYYSHDMAVTVIMTSTNSNPSPCWRGGRAKSANKVYIGMACMGI